MTPQHVIDAARAWIGTPFHHQGRALGVGVDCTGLILCAFNACGAGMADVIGYPRIPSGGDLRKELSARFSKVGGAVPQPGDVLELTLERDPTHVAIYTERGTIIHANGSPASALNRVIEHRFIDPWTRRLRGIWRHPAFEGTE